MKSAKVILTKESTLAIPAAYRRALDWHEGDELVLRLEDGTLRVVGLSRAIQRAQALARTVNLSEVVARLSDSGIAVTLDLPALTTDRAWGGLGLAATVRVIRQ
jgi:PIN domain nuclease of toxin-antitoxin system